jgi:hypothetical protein
VGDGHSAAGGQVNTPPGTPAVSSAKPLIFKFLEYGIMGTLILVLLGGFGVLGWLFIPRWLKTFDVHDAAAQENTKALGAMTRAMERIAVDVGKCTEGLASQDSLKRNRR